MKALLALAAAAVAALALAPPAQAGPVDDALYTAEVTVLCALIVVDGEMENVVGPMAGGSYPGRSVVQSAVILLGPGGTVGGPVNSVGHMAGAAWDSAFGAAIGGLRTAEDGVAALTVEAAEAANQGYEGVHELKCFVTHTYLLPTWYSYGRPAFCWAWGGPDACNNQPGEYVLLLGYAQCTLTPGGSLVVANYCGTPPVKPLP